VGPTGTLVERKVVGRKGKKMQKGGVQWAEARKVKKSIGGL